MQNELMLSIWTDGSFDSDYKIYGGGMVIKIDSYPEGYPIPKNGPLESKVSGHDPRYAVHANVAGELLAVMSAISIAKAMRATHVRIIYDYEGIELWIRSAKGKPRWRARKELTKMYVAFIEATMASGINIDFEWVKGHGDDPDNERADELAKEAVRECRKSLAIS